ncbi:MAG: hypothetical protein JJ966_11180 [Balneolaceae bacterium]|nr:hypothetical protein [Balneolaceae bacterium]
MRINHFLIFIFLITGFGCSVGTKLSIEANSLKYPISQSPSVFLRDGELANENEYEYVTDFSYDFKKWGNSTLNIQSDVDISNQLNEIIEENNGDAIVNLEVSMRNTSANSIMLFVKSIALMGSMISAAVTVSEPTLESSAFTGGFIATYLFTPANIDVQISGTVIRFVDRAQIIE